MKKIPCLFQRDFTDRRNPRLLESVTPGMEWVIADEGEATIKLDGTACAVIGGKLYKRYDAKHGKPAPVDGIPCDEPFSTLLDSCWGNQIWVPCSGAQWSSSARSAAMTTTEPWASVEDVAKHLGVAKDSVYRWIEARKLPAHRIGRLWKFKLSEVDEWVRAGGAQEDDGGGQQSKR